MLKRIEKHHRINAITLKKIISLNSPILEPRGSKEHKFVFDASFDIFTELSYENSSTRSSNSLPTLSTHTHTHSWGQNLRLETWAKVSTELQRGNDGRILAACLSSGRWKKGEENQWGFAARCCKPRAPLYHGPPRKIWKVHGSPVCCIQTKYLKWKRLERGREGVGRRRDCTSFRYWTGARQWGKGLQEGWRRRESRGSEHGVLVAAINSYGVL